MFTMLHLVLLLLPLQQQFVSGELDLLKLTAEEKDDIYDMWSTFSRMERAPELVTIETMKAQFGEKYQRAVENLNNSVKSGGITPAKFRRAMGRKLLSTFLLIVDYMEDYERLLETFQSMQKKYNILPRDKFKHMCVGVTNAMKILMEGKMDSIDEMILNKFLLAIEENVYLQVDVRLSQLE